MAGGTDPSTLGSSIQTAELDNDSVTNAKIAAHTTTKITVPYSLLSALALINADIAASAAIAYSKLALSNSIVNADISTSAAIAYSKLALSNSIVNADISTSAAIALSKLASLPLTTVGQQKARITADITTTSTSFVDATGISITLSNITGGKFIAHATLQSQNSGAGNGNFYNIVQTATNITETIHIHPAAAATYTVSLGASGAADGATLKLQWQVTAGTGTLKGNATGNIGSQIEALCVG